MEEFSPENLGQKSDCALFMKAHYTWQITVVLLSRPPFTNTILIFKSLLIFIF